MNDDDLEDGQGGGSWASRLEDSRLISLGVSVL